MVARSREETARGEKAMMRASFSELLERFEKRTKSVRENECALRFATRVLCEECVEMTKKKKKKKEKEKDEEDENAVLVRSREQKALLRRCFLHESRVVVDEISRRVCELVVENVVEKEVVTSELLAALEGMSDGTKGRFLVRAIYDICVLSSTKGQKDDSNNYMPLYRAMKSGAANVFSTVLYYATLKEDDIERFEAVSYTHLTLPTKA